MTATNTATTTETYSTVDIGVVMRRFTADLVMMATSTGALAEAKALEYGHDIELLAKYGYLRKVDITLLNGETELRASCYEVNTNSGELTTSRPGGLLWPRIANTNLRIILFYNNTYTDQARAQLSGKLKVGWVTTTADTTHASLTSAGNRDYASNGYGLQRKDFGQ